MSFMKELARGVVGALLPVVVLLAGAGIAAGGFALGWTWLVWTGGIVLAVGLLWALLVWMYASA